MLILLSVLCLALPALVPRQDPARAAATVCATPVTISNGDFEAPVIPANTMVLNPEADMFGWKTTASDKLFEHWREVRQGFTSGQGNQFIELNANVVSAVYQDLTTVPGQTLRWELKHRGRLGTDVMAVKIGPAVPNGPVQQGIQLADGSAAWGTHALDYTVPSGQTTTRFWFESISAAQNKPTYGNFLDAISFGSEPCMVATTTVSGAAGGATANVGDLLTYTVTAENKGGNPAKTVVLADDLPAGVTFVPNSIRTISGSSSTTVTDGADTDTGEYDAASRTVRVRAGLGAGAAAGGTVPVASTRAFSYQVRVGPSAASSTVTNDATAAYYNDIAAAGRTSTSTSAVTTVAAAADLGVTAVVPAPGVVAGRTATTVVTVTNTGPDDANAVQITAGVPFGIAGVTATAPLGTCSASTTPPAGPSTVSCTLSGPLPRNASTTVSISGTVLPQATPGAQATLTASVSSTTYEVNQADNATSVSAAVSTTTDLKVVQTFTPAAPVPGDTITYTATVTNQGPSQARGIMLTDPIATTSTFVSAAVDSVPPVPCSLAAATQTVECAVPDMMPGAFTTVTIVVSLPGAGAGTVNNAVSVSSSTPEADVRDNNHSVSKAGTPEADIGVDLVLGSNRAKPGDVVSFTLTVTNHGPWPAMNVSFNTIVPVGFTVNRAASPYCTSSACTLPGMVKDQIIKITGTTTVGQNAAAGVQSASTTVISPTADPNPSNDTSTVTFTIDLEADLTVSQTVGNPTAGETGLVAGQSVEGVVVVTNDGPTRAEGLVLRQTVPAGRPIPFATVLGAPANGSTCNFQGSGTPGTVSADGGVHVCTRPSLDRNATWRITFDGVQVARDHPGATFTRTATISATTPDPDGSDNTAVTSEPVEHRSDLNVTRTRLGAGTVVQTSDVSFEVTVRNDGPSDATNVVVREEPQAGLVIVSGTTTDGSFVAGALTWTVPQIPHNGTVRLTVAGIAQGSGTLTGTSRIIASDSTDPDSSDDSASATVTAVAAAPGLSLEVTSTAVPAAGGFADTEVISYSYRIVNTGNLDAGGLTVTGTRGSVAAGACTGGTLAAGASVTCPGGGYTVTSTDITDGVPIANEVKVVAQTAANAAPVEFARVVTHSPLVVAQASLVVVVTSAVSDPAHQNAAALGDTIGYDYVVTNNGNVSMTDVTLTDTKTGPITCGPQTLSAGQSMQCTTPNSSRYTVTQADLDIGGSVTDSARVTGRPGGGAVNFFGPFRASVTLAGPAPAIRLAVVSPNSGPVRVADTVDYEYQVTNIGNVTVDNLAVNDSRVAGVTCPAQVAVGHSLSCLSAPAQPYVVTQADVDRDRPIHNDAIVSADGVTPGSPTVTAEGGASVPVIASAPALTLGHTVTVPPGGVILGDRLSFLYQVQNTGNVTMSDLALSDTLNGAAFCPYTSLSVGAGMTCTVPAYRVTQANVDATGPIAGTADLRGRAPTQPAAVGYDTDPLSVTVAAGSTELSVAVSAAVSPAGHRTAVEPGDRIAFTYAVTNIGTVTMQGIAATDTLFGPATCARVTLAPGATAICSPPRQYTVTAADILAGGAVVTRVTVTARGPGRPVRTFGPASGNVAVLVPVPSLRVTPAAELSSGRPGPASTGDRITYRYEVVNTGNQPMSGISVVAGLAGPVTCPTADLAVRQSMTCTSQPYVVTEADVEAGKDLVDESTVVGQALLGSSPSTYGPFTVSVGVAVPDATLRLTTEAEISVSIQSVTVSAGNGVRYRYAVTNSGNITVSGVGVDDVKAGTVTCDNTRLLPGATTACAADRTYRVTQADIDAGDPLVTRAVARGVHGTAPVPVASNTADTTVPVAPPAPSLTADQTASWTDTDGDGRLSILDDVVSILEVRNTGNVTLLNLRVAGLPATVTCRPDRVPPGGTARCVSAVYHLTRDEIDRGHRTFEAHVSGDLVDLDAPPAEATAPSTVVIPAAGPTPSPTTTRSPGPTTSPPTGTPTSRPTGTTVPTRPTGPTRPADPTRPTGPARPTGVPTGPGATGPANPATGPTASPSRSDSPPAGGDVPATGTPSMLVAAGGIALVVLGGGLLGLTYHLRPRYTPTHVR